MPKGNKTKEQKMEDDLLDKLADKLNEDCEEQIVQKVARGKKAKKEKKVDSDGKPKADSDGKPKAKRAPSAYNIFVKEHYKDEDIQKLEPKQRLGAIAKLWKSHKTK